MGECSLWSLLDSKVTYGFEINTSGNAKQLNEKMRAFRVVSQGSATATTDGLSYGFMLPGNLLTGERMIFLRNRIGYSGYLSASLTYSTTTNQTRIGVSDAGVFDYVVVDTTGWSPASGFGLVIRDSAGNLTFNSSDTLMVLTTIVYKAVTYNTPNTVETIPISCAPYATADVYFPVFSSNSVFINSGTSRKMFQCFLHLTSNTAATLRVYGDSIAPGTLYQTSHTFVIPFGIVR